jgi:alkaline phosphatase
MFLAEPDRIGQTNEFSLLWSGPADYAGAILSQAEGLNAELLSTKFSARFDNIDAYRMMYVTLFGKLLKYPEGSTAVAR